MTQCKQEGFDADVGFMICVSLVCYIGSSFFSLESKPRLFDAVTIHQYGPTNGTITRAAQTDALQRVATLAAVGPSLRFMESYVASGIAPSVPIWLDEFNW